MINIFILVSEFLQILTFAEGISEIKRKNCTLSDKTFICSEHFKLTDHFVLPGNSRPKLKLDVVRSKFNFPSYMRKPCPKKRLSRNSIASSSNVNTNVTEVHKHDDSHDKIVQANLSKSSPRKRKIRRKIKTLQQPKRRKKVKIDGLSSIIKTSKNRKFLSKEISESLLEQFSGTSKTIIENEKKKKKKN